MNHLRDILVNYSKFTTEILQLPYALTEPDFLREIFLFSIKILSFNSKLCTLFFYPKLSFIMSTGFFLPKRRNKV